MIFEYGTLAVCDFVLYKEANKGWLPALITAIHPPAERGKPPKLDLVIFVNGMHGTSFGRTSVEHGGKNDHWLTREGAEQYEELEAEKLEALKRPPLEEVPKSLLDEDPPKDTEPTEPTEPTDESAAPEPATKKKAK